ncbi:uncharacterized protein N7483_005757 [Penicillium malachiteum]|uniref:uncharacterized protein n=1 Tax=Penicillium malachiteum TaxID=1324776 RepID=UPI0025499E09|nr:uncharacterized protein N7483_005757 [Penicillium malachiteum]KAJ5731249.1 hypothetical protein N7483_005757 [Penicillium malachiteum]
MGSTSDSFSNDSVPQQHEQDTTIDPESKQNGVMTSVKSQLDPLTGTNSVEEFKDQAVAVAGETAAALKEVVMNTAVPVAGEALQNIGTRIRDLAGGVGEAVEETLEDPDREAHAERIDQMDTERICDFLREKHQSTSQPPRTN